MTKNTFEVVVLLKSVFVVIVVVVVVLDAERMSLDLMSGLVDSGGIIVVRLARIFFVVSAIGGCRRIRWELGKVS